MDISWLVHNGKKIMFQDFCNMSSEEFLSLLVECEEEYKKAIEPLLILVDITGCYMSQLQKSNYSNGFFAIGFGVFLFYYIKRK